jgi:exopolysaccharide biosynthesis predicted pyruvyltransferase EpsI
MAKKLETEKLAALADEISVQVAPLLDGAPFALLDYPDHSNVGDSAIWLGETRFFAANGMKPAYCSTLKSHVSGRMAEVIGNGTIFLHGGGNFGTIWKAHQDFRIAMLERFPHQRIVQLPQSIHFDSDLSISETARAIDRHGKFTLLVRDRPSLAFAKRHFQCEVILCPDMAFYLGPLQRKTAKNDIFYLLRTDREGVINGNAQHHDKTFEVGDWLSESPLAIRALRAFARLSGIGADAEQRRLTEYERVAMARLCRGIDMLSSGRVVVTDRLHGHIMSTLLGIPHVALDNSYGKLQNFIEAWTADIGYLRTATSLPEAAVEAEKLLP